MSDAECCDTNVLLYAHDITAPPEKQERAQDRLENLWMNRRRCLSTQVLQAFYVRVVQVRLRTMRRVLATLSNNPCNGPSSSWNRPTDLVCAMKQSERYRFSFWDALLVTAAQKAHASVLWTEDLNVGQRVGDVIIRNPFVSTE